MNAEAGGKKTGTQGVFPRARRIERLPGQFFAALVKKVMALRTDGHDPINLGQGNPDLATPPHIVAALAAAAREPWTHRYCLPFSGVPEVKQAVARWYRRQFDVTVDPETQVAVLFGSKAGLVELPLILLDEGQGCLMPDPGYPDYWSGVALAGGEPLPLPLDRRQNYWPDLDGLSPAVINRSRMMFVNYPNNPTGVTAPGGRFESLVSFAAQHGIALIHDLAYGMITFDGRKPVSFLQTPGAADVGLEIYTLSKSYNMAGWRVAFAVGNSDLVAGLNLLQDHMYVSLFPAVQMAAAAALDGPQDSVAELAATYQERRDVFVRPLQQAGWPVPMSGGTFYVWFPVPRTMDSVSFADYILSETHVVLAPGRGFGELGEGYVRVSLTEPAERLAAAAERLARLPVYDNRKA